MISVKNIVKKFGDRLAVDDVSFEVQTGEIVGFLGPNGAGKSTTMRIITGFTTPTSGDVLINDSSIFKKPLEAKQQIGYLPEMTPLYSDMAVIDFLKMMGELRGLKDQLLKDRLRVVISQCQLTDVLTRTISELSKGYKQRVGLAQALIHDPKILILDEPTAGLDPNQVIEIRNLIRSIGKEKTILLSTHVLSEVTAMCGRVIILSHGKLVAQGTPSELMASSQGATIHRVAVKDSPDTMIGVVSQIPGYLRHTLEPANDNVNRVRFFFRNAEDHSEAIFDAAVATKSKLVHLSRDEQSLEDVFSQLTK